MPSLWEKLRASRRKSKAKKGDHDDDEFASPIRQRESYIENGSEDWVEVDHPKSRSLGRGMRLESTRIERNTKSRTLDLSVTGFGSERKRGKNEWKPKVKDIEENKLKTKEDKEKKVELKRPRANSKDKDDGKLKIFEKRKDKRKSKEFDSEPQTQLERGESFVVGRKMVLWRSDRRRDRLSKVSMDMEPVSQVDEWAASACSVSVSGTLGRRDSQCNRSETALVLNIATVMMADTATVVVDEKARAVVDDLKQSEEITSDDLNDSNGQCRAHVVPAQQQSCDEPGPVLEPPFGSAPPLQTSPVPTHNENSSIIQSAQCSSTAIVRQSVAAEALKKALSIDFTPKLTKSDLAPIPESPVEYHSSGKQPACGDALMIESPYLVYDDLLIRSPSDVSGPPYLVYDDLLIRSPTDDTGPILQAPSLPIKSPSRNSNLNFALDHSLPTITEASEVQCKSSVLAHPSCTTNGPVSDSTSDASSQIVPTSPISILGPILQPPSLNKLKDSSSEHLKLSATNYNLESTPAHCVSSTDNDVEASFRNASVLSSDHTSEKPSSPSSTSDVLDIASLLTIEGCLPEFSQKDSGENLHNSALNKPKSRSGMSDGSLTSSPDNDKRDLSEFNETGAAVAACVTVDADSRTDHRDDDGATCGQLLHPELNSSTSDWALLSPQYLELSPDGPESLSRPDDGDKTSGEAKAFKSELSERLGAYTTTENIGTSTTADFEEFYITSTKFYENEQLPENGVFMIEINESQEPTRQDFGALHIDLPNESPISPPDLCDLTESQDKSSYEFMTYDTYEANPLRRQACHRNLKPICLVAYPRRLMNLSPCERCSRSIDCMLSSVDAYSSEIDLESPMEQDVHDWVLVEKDFESPKISKRTFDKIVQTDERGIAKSVRVVSSNCSSVAENLRVEREQSTERTPSFVGSNDGCDSILYDDYVTPVMLLRPSDANHYRISGQCSDEFELFGQMSPSLDDDQSNKANATGGKPGASGSKATSQQQIKGAHQPDLVSNSIGSRAHAAQEISRLEALCEARTKELTFAKMQIKSASQGFDAMSVIVQYLTFELGAFSTPDLIGRLKAKEKKINDLRCSLDDLRKEKSRIESTMHDLIQSHKEATEAMRADHRAQINAIEERVSEKYEESQQKVIDQHSEEVKTLKSYHEKRHKELQDQTERACEELRRKHAQQLRDLEESDERHLTELQKQHEIKLEEITKRFEEIKFTLHDKVYTLKSECDELRSRSLMYEEALQRDTSFQVQLALAPYRDLPQEINSLQAVLDMRNKEIHELRVARAELEHRLDELPTARERIISLEQKIENLEAIITMKADYERQLVEKHQMLLRRFDKESKANKRLSMDNEELMYRLNESEDFLLSPTPECRTGNGRSPDGQSPDVISRRGFCRSPHDGATGIPSLHAGVTRRQRTCSTSSSDEKRSSTISMRSDDGKTT